MYWNDEGFLLSKNNFDENSIIIETFTSDHGKCIGVVYGGASKKQKRNFQIGNKILVNWRSKGENKMGYFTIELGEQVRRWKLEESAIDAPSMTMGSPNPERLNGAG